MHSPSIFSYVWGRFDPAARFLVAVRIGLVAIAIGVIANASGILSSFDHPAPRATNTDTVADATSVRVQAASPPGPQSLASATATPISVTPSGQSQVQEPTLESSRSSDHFQPANPNATSVSPTPGSVAALPEPVPVPNATSVSPTPGSVAALPDSVPVTIATQVFETPDKPIAASDKIGRRKKSVAASDKIWRRKKSVKKLATTVKHFEYLHPTADSSRSYPPSPFDRIGRTVTGSTQNMQLDN
jgi:hypothetical protein